MAAAKLQHHCCAGWDTPSPGAAWHSCHRLLHFHVLLKPCWVYYISCDKEDLYEILPLRFACFLSPSALLHFCIFHEDFQGSFEPIPKAPRAFLKVTHTYLYAEITYWDVLGGGLNQTVSWFWITCVQQRLPWPQALHLCVGCTQRLLVLTVQHSKTRHSLRQGMFMARPVALKTEHFALVLSVHQALKLLLLFTKCTKWCRGVDSCRAACCTLKGFKVSVCCLSLVTPYRNAKPVHHRAAEIYGNMDASRTVGSKVLPTCLTCIMAESTDSGNKSVRKGFAFSYG